MVLDWTAEDVGVVDGFGVGGRVGLVDLRGVAGNWFVPVGFEVTACVLYAACGEMAIFARVVAWAGMECVVEEKVVGNVALAIGLGEGVG